MTVSIRSIHDQELWDALFPLSQYAFHTSPPFQDKEEWLGFVRGRRGITCYAVYEDEKPVSIAISSAMTQNMRGVLYPASGVWAVSTHPAARRKGYVRQTIARLLAAERDSGKVFTNLYPFRESFYERLGYVTLPLVKIAKFSPHGLAPLLKMNLEGEVELAMIADAFDAYRQALAEIRLSRHGMAFFDDDDMGIPKRNRHWAAFARFDGKVEGLMLYAMQSDAAGKNNLVAPRFYYQTSRARYLLLEWIARHIDQANLAELWLPGDETPETWLADIQVSIEVPPRAAMTRVLDVAKLGGMTVGGSGLAAGSFTARITDPLCPWNEGTWRFEARDGRLHVSTAAEADCELTIQGLTALVAGTHDPQDFPLRGWGNAGAELQAVQRTLFPRLFPFIHEVF